MLGKGQAAGIRHRHGEAGGTGAHSRRVYGGGTAGTAGRQGRHRHEGTAREGKGQGFGPLPQSLFFPPQH